MNVSEAAGVTSAQGKDISNFQGIEPVSFWSGYQFGFAKATEGTTFLDGTFPGNWLNMKRAGIHRGAYHFFHPALDPIAQAKFFVNYVKKEGLGPGDMLVADVEITSGGFFSRLATRLGLTGVSRRNNLVQQHVSLGTVNVAAGAFLNEVKALVGPRCPILVYSNLSVGSQLSACTGYPLWIAYPSSSAPSNVSPWKKWTFWQWGMTGVDRDAFNGTATELDAFISSYSNPPPPPPPPPVTGPPYKHVVSADTSVFDLATSRNNSVGTFLTRQGELFTDADGKATVWKKGSVYYTIFP